jgi:hypothetical protein
MFSHKAAQQKHRGDTTIKGWHHQNIKGGTSRPTRAAPAYQQGQHPTNQQGLNGKLKAITNQQG